MLLVKVKDGYGVIRDRYINPDKVKYIGETIDGPAVWFDDGKMFTVCDAPSDLARQWESCIGKKSGVAND